MAALPTIAPALELELLEERLVLTLLLLLRLVELTDVDVELDTLEEDPSAPTKLITGPAVAAEGILST